MTPLPWTNAKTANGMLNAVMRVIKEDYRRISMNFVCVRIGSIPRYRNLINTLISPPCGAVGCVAGWVLILTNRTSENEYNLGDTSTAGRILGLSYEQERELFYPQYLVEARSEFQTARHANEVIRHIRAFQNKYRKQLLATKLDNYASQR